MRFSRSRRKSGLEAILSGLGRAMVWGMLILVALKLDAPKRLLELYRSLSGEAGNVTAGATTGEVNASNDAIGNDRATDDTGLGDASVTPVNTATSGSTAVESGTVGALDARDARHAETAAMGIGDNAAATDVDGVGADAADAAGYHAPDAGLSTKSGTGARPGVSGNDVLTAASTESATVTGSGLPEAERLVTARETNVDDRESGDVGAADSGTAAPEPERQDEPGVPSNGDDANESVPGIVTEDEDAVPGDGTAQCPEGFPIKGNGRSRLYHMPEGFAYPRTKPEVCFRTPEAAERAGFRRAKG